VHTWAGIDAGKAHHHCVVTDADGNDLRVVEPVKDIQETFARDDVSPSNTVGDQRIHDDVPGGLKGLVTSLRPGMESTAAVISRPPWQHKMQGFLGQMRFRVGEMVQPMLTPSSCSKVLRVSQNESILR
jgi:hypothetical protein